ncbi:MAG: response regulator [Bryobacterales bacterium]|nr:response regulator [Bryobacterales bacterium]
MNAATPAKLAIYEILLVDHNRLGLSARQSVLEEAGYRITATASPAEALEKFREQAFDLVITGYKLPKMNGIELIGQIRSHCATVPVIMISGYADALGLDSRSTGADIVIQKGANEVSHLVRAVARLAKRKAARKPPASQSDGSNPARRVRRRG